MRILLLLAALLLTGALAACGSDDPTATTPPTPAPVATQAPTVASAPAPTAAQVPPATQAPAPTPAPTAVATPAPAATQAPAATPVPTATPVPAPEPEPTEAPFVQEEPDGTPVDGGVLQLLWGIPTTLDPHLSGDISSARYVVEIFGGLVTIDPDLMVAPDLAEYWEISPDGRAYTFRINPAATFHDGRKVTASDAQWSLERATAPATESPTAGSYLSDIVGVSEKLAGETDSISGISAIDDETLQLRIDLRKAYFLSKLTYPTAFVVDRANVETGPEWAQSPNGTGPFMLTEYNPEERIRLERFENYHLGPAMVEAVESAIPGADALELYRNGEVSYMRLYPEEFEFFLDPDSPLYGQMHRAPPELSTFYIGMNVNEPPFDDLNVRLALNYAIDRETLSNVVNQGATVPAYGVLPPGFPGYSPGLESYEFDPEKARQLLAQSKYGSDTASYPPITITMSGAPGTPISDSSQAILDGWEEHLGITMDVAQMEWADYLQELDDNDLQMYQLGWIADYLDPENFLDVLFHSESGENHSNLSDPELDALLERARVALVQDARFSLYRQAEQMILDLALWVPLYHSGGRVYGIQPNIKGLPLVPVTVPILRYAYFTE